MPPPDSVTKEKRSRRCRSPSLSAAFYEMQRNRVMKENESLRRRIAYLESRLAQVRALANQTAAACLL